MFRRVAAGGLPAPEGRRSARPSRTVVATNAASRACSQLRLRWSGGILFVVSEKDSDAARGPDDRPPAVSDDSTFAAGTPARAEAPGARPEFLPTGAAGAVCDHVIWIVLGIVAAAALCMAVFTDAFFG